jgi:hypothetical protein
MKDMGTLGPDILKDKERFLLRVLKEPGKDVTVPNSIKSDPATVAEGLITILRKVLIGRTGSASINATGAEQIIKRLSDWWGYNQNFIEKDLGATLSQKSNKHNGSTLTRTLFDIKDWAAAYSKELNRDEIFLRSRAMDFIEDSFKNLTGLSTKSEPQTRSSILRELIEFTPWQPKAQLHYHLACPEGKRRLTISEFAHDSGKVTLEDDPVSKLLSDWKLEPMAADKQNIGEFKITAKVTQLALTGEVADKGSLRLLLKPKESSTGWMVYKHRKLDKYTIINDTNDCLLGCRDQDPLSPRLDKKEDVWAWSVKPSPNP